MRVRFSFFFNLNHENKFRGGDACFHHFAGSSLLLLPSPLPTLPPRYSVPRNPDRCGNQTSLPWFQVRFGWHSGCQLEMSELEDKNVGVFILPYLGHNPYAKEHLTAIPLSGLLHPLPLIPPLAGSTSCQLLLDWGALFPFLVTLKLSHTFMNSPFVKLFSITPSISWLIDCSVSCFQPICSWPW